MKFEFFEFLSVRRHGIWGSNHMKFDFFNVRTLWYSRSSSTVILTVLKIKKTGGLQTFGFGAPFTKEGGSFPKPKQ